MAVSVFLIALYILLIWKAGKVYPVIYLFFFTYFIQYLFSAYLIYYQYPDTLGVQMHLSPERYFVYAIPALLSLFAGVIVINRDVDLKVLLERVDPTRARYYGFSLISVSVAIDLLSGVWPVLQSVASFTTFLKYIGAFALLLGRSPLNYATVALLYGYLLYTAVQTGVFISFFIWSTFLFFFVVLVFRVPFWLRAGFIVLAIPVLILVQSVKKEYRKEVWNGKREGGISVFFDVLTNEFQKFDGSILQSRAMVRTVGRLTEAWHLGLTLKHVPEKEPFAYGRELLSDIFSAFMPRVLSPEKKVVGTHEKFYRFTGYKVPGRYSMSIGVLGDFYVNFGRWGSLAGLFLLGAMIAKLLHLFVVKFVLPDPLNVVWIPFMLMYFIRANNDFYIFFNALVKGFFIFLCFNFIWSRFTKRLNKMSDSSMVSAGQSNRILILYDHFAPAFKAGGPVQSLVNLVTRLKGKYSMYVVCSARDMGESQLLTGIKADAWNDFNDTTKVFYSSRISARVIETVFKEADPSVVYINGMFLPFYNWLPLYIARKQKRKIVLAPRGMLQQGALAVKPLKKKVFLSLFKLSGLYKNITWHATDAQEQLDIKKLFGQQADVRIAFNIPKSIPDVVKEPAKLPGTLKLVYLSLITEKKNLHLVLEALQTITTPVTFDIYGPVKDAAYWQRCQLLMTNSIHAITYKGVVEPHEVQGMLRNYDAFILPTKGENFGHAIYEALSVGLPVIISPFTPWNFENKTAGVIADNTIASVAGAIEYMTSLSLQEYQQMSQAALKEAKDYYNSRDYAGDYQNLFLVTKDRQ